jgi:hypothetical protein
LYSRCRRHSDFPQRCSADEEDEVQERGAEDLDASDEAKEEDEQEEMENEPEFSDILAEDELREHAIEEEENEEEDSNSNFYVQQCQADDDDDDDAEIAAIRQVR